MKRRLLNTLDTFIDKNDLEQESAQKLRALEPVTKLEQNQKKSNIERA